MSEEREIVKSSPGATQSLSIPLGTAAAVPPTTAGANNTIARPPTSKSGGAAAAMMMLPPHTSRASYPSLASAPPSGNLALALSTTQSRSKPTSRSTSPLSSTAAASSPARPTSATFDPLPPPPKLSGVATSKAAAAAAASSSFQSTPSSSSSPPSVALIPPPPTIAALPRNPSGTDSNSNDSSIDAQQYEQYFAQQLGGSSINTAASSAPEEQAADLMPAVAAAAAEENNPTPSALLPPVHVVPYSHWAEPKLQVLSRAQSSIPILTVATEAAHKLAHKNQLELSDLLQGLYNQQYMNANMPPFRSATKSFTPSRISLRFIDRVAEMTPAAAQSMLQRAVHMQDADGNLAQDLLILEDNVDNLLQQDDDDAREVIMAQHEMAAARQTQWEQVVKDAYGLTSPTNLPWMWRYRQALDETCSVTTHDMLSCPPICLLVCSTQEWQNPLDTLKNLQSPHYLPAALQPHSAVAGGGLYDPHQVTYQVLLLHDNVDGPYIDENQLRSSLQSTFGPTAALVRINSQSLATAALLAHEETRDVWGGAGQLGNCLSQSDRVRLRNFLTHFVAASLLPCLERRIANLNAIVSERKRGVRNVLKSFWGGGGGGGGRGEEGVESGLSRTTTASTATTTNKASGAARYRFDSIESQTRVLADILFWMKDYEAALSTYRLIKDDYKTDKAHAYYASCQEMMALCMYEMDAYGRAREIFSLMENALLSYGRAADEESAVWGEKPGSGRPTMAPLATRCATRLCLVLITTRHLCSGRHLEVADLLASASSPETALGAAVLLEQSSAHYYHANMFRKYAFHMLMSGHMFRSADQEHHAFRCFTSALYVYRDGKWDELHNHLRSALAAQLFSMDRMALSLQLYAKLVGSTNGGRVSVKSQQKFINHLLEICNDHTKKALVGADRMVAPAHLSSAERDRVRKERFDRIVQVVKYTKSASRVLELPNIDLPLIEDSTVVVSAEELAKSEQSVMSLGREERGEDDKWAELMLVATAELRAESSGKTKVDDETFTKALAMIDDPQLRRVIAEIDKEQLSRQMKERTKKSASYKESAPVRAMMEPITVEFAISNPLGVPIDLAHMQLVARMTDADGEHVCTNEDAIKITPLRSFDQSKNWSFQDSSTKFEAAHFCRVSEPSDEAATQRWKSADEVSPFFVVTKINVSLEPESRRFIALKICPLTQGDLQIVGVRCRLLDNVWVYHEFNVKGPLLQNSRSNRANRVRAEPMILKAKVERGMPCLKANIIPHDDANLNEKTPFLDGQITEWRLRVSNVGTAAANRLSIKTNLPWIELRSAESSVDVGIDDDLGVSGTLVHVPVRGDQLEQEGLVQPGEDFDVSIRVRTTGSRRQQFYFLLYYELARSDIDRDGPRPRWLRKMYDVALYPSLSLTATAAPSFDKAKEHLLTVNLSNLRSDRPDKLDLVPLGVCVASRAYSFEQIAAQFGETEDISIGCQERISIHYALKEDSAQKESVQLRSQSLAKSSRGRYEPAMSALHFMRLERAHEESKTTWETHQRALARAAAQQDHEDSQPRSIASIRRAKTTVTGSDLDETEIATTSESPSSLETLLPANQSMSSLHVLCHWQNVDGTVQGLLHLRDVVVRPDADNDDICPVTVTAQYPSTPVVADFARGPLAIPVTFVLRNQVHVPVQLQVVVEQAPNFDWIGPERFVAKLDAGATLQLPLEALVYAAGVYNLQRLAVTVLGNDKENTSHNAVTSDAVTYEYASQWVVTAVQKTSVV